MSSTVASNVRHLLTNTAHRPWPVPVGAWSYYQEWNNALFLHFKVAADKLRPLVPGVLDLDERDGSTWMSMVAFTMQRIHPRGLFPVPGVSDLEEFNVRTYVSHQGRRGVYFLNIEAGKLLPAWLARTLSVLPYRHAEVLRTSRAHGSDQLILQSSNHACKCNYRIGGTLQEPDELDRWLTERYCLYQGSGSAVWRYDVHHTPWPLRDVEVSHFETDMSMNGERVYAQDLLRCHYSPGVQVLSWDKVTIPG
jgi:uncharacterized protein